MSEKIDKDIEKMEKLASFQREAETWNKSKHKNSSNAKMSKILLEAQRKELEEHS